MLTGEEKVALLLSSLPSELADSLLARLTPEQAERLRARLANLTETPAGPDQIKAAAEEFASLMRIVERPVLNPGEAGSPNQYGESGRTGQPGETRPQETPPPPPEADPLEALRLVPPETLALALRGERLSTITLILGCLETAPTAEVLRRLPTEIRLDATTRLSQTSTTSREILHRVARAVLARCEALAEEVVEPSVDDKIQRLADLVRALSREDRKEVMERLDKSDPDTAEKVRGLLYRISDVLRIDDRTLQGILTELDVKTLAVALKNSEEEVKSKVLSNVSKRARETVTEEMELLGNVPTTKIQQAQGQLLSIIQRLDAEGKLFLE